MKWLWLLSFSFYLNFTFAQSKPVSFSFTDARAEDIDATSPDTLAYLLTARCITELEKVKSIFHWITENISYNTVRYQPTHTYYDDGMSAEADADTSLKTLDQRIAYKVLKRRFALCDGYARLFKTLCDYAGVKSEVISGYSRNGFGSGQFRCNHKWNAVMIDSNWYLLDATWASGYLNYSGTSFIKDYNDYYFLTPPKYFVQDHYPEELKWTLLSNPPVFAEFNRSPFKNSSFSYKIISYAPSKGVINATVGDTIHIILQTDDDKRNLCLSDITFPDSADIAFTDSASISNKECIIKGDKVTASYIVTNGEAQWLQVIYNGDIILRYKLNIKKQPFPFAPIFIPEIDIRN